MRVCGGGLGPIRPLLRFAALAAAMIVLTFLLPRLLPGDPIAGLGDQGTDTAGTLPADVRRSVAAYYGLDRPLAAQFAAYLERLVRLDLGWSYALRRPVSSLMAERAPYTLGLVGAAVVGSAVLGSALGIAAAWRRGSALDGTLTGVLLGLGALPEFLVGVVLIALFAVAWPVLPARGASTPFLSLAAPPPGVWWWDGARHFVLPAAALTLATLPQFFYLMRNALVPLLDAPHLTAARAKGLSEPRVALRHAAPIALLPVASLFGMRLAFVAGGAVVVERLFNYPGIGLLMVQSVWARDYPVLEACFLVFSLAVLLANLTVDVLMRRLDPRIGSV